MDTNWQPALEKASGPRYLAIVRAMADDIASGRLVNDTRLPTQRELADRLQLAIGTITRAYAEAERRGLIRSEGRRGTFVGAPQTGRSVLSIIANGSSNAIDMSKNHPHYALDPHLPTALRQIARDRNTQRLLEYAPAAGLARHREAGARWFAELGAKTEPESIFVTAGAQHALSIIVAAETSPGDTIAAEKLTYPGIKAVAELLGLQVAGVAMDRDGILPDSLDSVCRQRAVRLLYLNPSLQNPTTSVMSAQRRKEIADVAERHGVTVIEDEIMRPMMPEHPGYITTLIPDQTYLVMSASKAIAAGLRVGFVRAPSKARQRMIEGLNASCLGIPPLMAELFAMWQEDGTVERTIARRRTETQARQNIAITMLKGLVVTGHPASYHVWLELPEGWTGMKLMMEAQLRGVAVTPADAFSVEKKPPVEAVRLSIGVPPTRELLRTGLQIITDILQGLSGRKMPVV